MPLPKEMVAEKIPITGPSNHVTLFSNGMGYFQRVYEVLHGEEKKISIPFKKVKDHMRTIPPECYVKGR